jgi:hypothetical protein
MQPKKIEIACIHTLPGELSGCRKCMANATKLTQTLLHLKSVALDNHVATTSNLHALIAVDDWRTITIKQKDAKAG